MIVIIPNTFPDYEQYVNGIHQAMQEFSKANNLTMQLRGPAGLFKNRDTHKFCWSAIEKCNENIKNCPFDVITFHRKGHGRFYEIVDGTKQLIDDLLNAFPNIRDLPFSNKYYCNFNFNYNRSKENILF